MALTKIPPNLHQQIMNWHAEGKPVRSMRALLQNEYQITIGNEGIYRIIKKYRKERQEVARAIYAQELAHTAFQDIQIMSDVVQSLYIKYKNAVCLKDELAIAAELRLWVRDKVVITGAGDDKNDNSVSREEFLLSLKKLSLNASKSEIPALPPKDDENGS